MMTPMIEWQHTVLGSRLLYRIDFGTYNIMRTRIDNTQHISYVLMYDDAHNYHI